jgi:hypothetical protein
MVGWLKLSPAMQGMTLDLTPTSTLVKENTDPVGYRFPSPFGMDTSHETDAYERSVSQPH